MKQENFDSLTFEKTGFEEIEKMIVAIFPDSKITMEKEDLFFKATSLGNVLGFIHLGKRKDLWMIIGIGVVPESRMKGYGTEILKFGIETVRKMLGHSISLSVEEDNHDAIGVYSKLGFRKIGKSGKRIRMMLVLNS